jgi:hypothetical protein
MAVPETSLTLTDRLAVKLYATNSGGKTTTIHTQDGHLCQIITTFSTGITALNGLTAQVQYFQTGTSGTDFNISSTTATHTFNLPTASAANRGALSSADWSTFNSKQGTVFATAPISIVSNNISITQASASVDGYLSSTDFNTFNNKISGLGTAGYITRYTGSGGTIGNSGLYDDGTTVSLISRALSGSSASFSVSSGTVLNVAGNAIFRGDTGVGTPRQLIITSGGSTPVYLEAKGYGANYQTDFGIRTYNNVGTAFEVFYADSSGRVGINQVSPSYQLDVNGTGRFTTSLGIGSAGAYASTTLLVRSNSATSTNWAFIAEDNATNQIFGIRNNGNVGIGTTPSARLEVKQANSLDYRGLLVVDSATPNWIGLAHTGSAGVISVLYDGAGSFTPMVFKTSDTERMRITSGGQVGIGVTPSAWSSATFPNVLQVGYASLITNGGAFAQLSSNLYYDGTAYKYISTNGASRIILDSDGAITFNNAASGTGGTTVTTSERMRITSGGNVLIGTTTDGGYKLQVNGTLYTADMVTIGIADISTGENKGLRLNNTGSGGKNWNITAGKTGSNNADFVVRNSTTHANVLALDGTSGSAEFISSIYATAFFESSDNRLKTLIQDNYQTKGIASITPKLYTKNGKVELGYYAQDFVGILDSAVSKGSDDMLSLSYREVHTAKIYALEQEIKELKAKLN